jgi:hypothetical protein
VRTTVPPDYLDIGGEPIRSAQRNFIENLLEQREVPADFSSQDLLDRYREDRIDKDRASELIDALLVLPRVYRGGRAAGRTADLPEVPAGRYCIFGGPGSKAQFYRVRHGGGQYQGWTYLDSQISDDFYPVIGVGKARRILENINKDPKRAAERYSHLLGKCYRCGRTLTNTVSRHIGCGPICARKTGWYSSETIAMLEEAGE